MSNEAADFFDNYGDVHNQAAETSTSKDDVPSSSFSRSLRIWRRVQLEASTSPDESEGDGYVREEETEDDSNKHQRDGEFSTTTTPADIEAVDSLTVTYYPKHERRSLPSAYQPSYADAQPEPADDNITFTYYTKRPPTSQPPSAYVSYPHHHRQSGYSHNWNSQGDAEDSSNQLADDIDNTNEIGENYYIQSYAAETEATELDEEQEEEQQPDSLTFTYYSKKTGSAQKSDQQKQQYQQQQQQQHHQQQYSFPTKMLPQPSPAEKLQQQHLQSSSSSISAVSVTGSVPVPTKGHHVRQASEVSHSSSIEAYQAYERQEEEEEEEGVYGEYGEGEGDEEETGVYGYGIRGEGGDEEVVDFTGGGRGGAGGGQTEKQREGEEGEDPYQYSSYYDDYQFDEEEEEEQREGQEEEVYDEDAYEEEKMEQKEFDSPMPARTNNNKNSGKGHSIRSGSSKERTAAVSALSGDAEEDGGKQHLSHQKSFNRVDCMPARKTAAAVGGKNQDYLALARQYRLERPYQDPGYKAVCVLCKASLCADVFFPCQHRCVCRACIKKENICDERAMVNNPNGYCMCSLCASVIKLILPNEGGDEVEKYWRWVYEEPVELPPQFLRDFKHSAGVIKAVYLDNDKEYARMKGVKKDGDCAVS